MGVGEAQEAGGRLGLGTVEVEVRVRMSMAGRVQARRYLGGVGLGSKRGAKGEIGESWKIKLARPVEWNGDMGFWETMDLAEAVLTRLQLPNGNLMPALASPPLVQPI